MVNYKFVLQGKKSKAVGEMFEQIISNSCRWYDEKGIATIEKQHEPLHAVGTIGKGMFRAVYVDKAGVDFKGTLYGGTSIAFEAKHTDKPMITRDRLQPHQIEYLKKHMELGAITFVLVSFGLKNYYKIPFKDWLNMKEVFGRVSLKEDMIQQYKVRNIGTIIYFLDGEIK